MRLLIPVVFFSLAAWFALGPREITLRFATAANVDSAELSTDPLRMLPDRLDVVRIGGLEQRCSDCHALFESAATTPEDLKQHTDIVMHHGINTDCFNCHAREDRDLLELYGGELVPMSSSEVLCAKCHGPTYRDWLAGMHGRSMESWQRDDPSFRLLHCVECHDPHAPAVGGIVPLPGPNSWRATPVEHHESAFEENPLRGAYRWNGAGGIAPDAADPEADQGADPSEEDQH